jgi:hypothetical protein
MSINQSGNPGSDKPNTNSIEHAHSETDRVQIEANKMAKKGENTLKHSESNQIFTK